MTLRIDASLEVPHGYTYEDVCRRISEFVEEVKQWPPGTTRYAAMQYDYLIWLRDSLKPNTNWAREGF
jgi:hypothetical protein